MAEMWKRKSLRIPLPTPLQAILTPAVRMTTMKADWQADELRAMSSEK
jgi:hypothetical protein